MKKLVIMMAIILAVVLFRISGVYAETKTTKVDLDKEYKEFVFSITWEKSEQKAEITAISPSGDKFGLAETPEKVSATPGRFLINVGTAEAGIWKVEITGEKLGKVEITAGELPGAMIIERFEVIKANGGYKATWEVSDCPENIRVEIYADEDSKGFDGVRVDSFSSNSTSEKILRMSNLNSGHYFYYIKVYDDLGAYSYAYTNKALLYENPDSPEKLPDVKANILNGDVFITWEGDSGNYKVMLFSKTTNELLAEETTQDNSMVMAFPEGQDAVLAAAALYEGNRLGRYDLFEVDRQSIPEAEVLYPEENATNQTAIFVEASFNGSYNVSATLNDELLLEKSEGPGKYQVNLKEGMNDIVFIIADNNGNMRTFPKEIYMDNTPPQLGLKREFNNLKTGDPYIYIEGYSEAGASLFCNDKPIELVSSHFSHKYMLSFGKNEIVILAKDIAGNESRYSAVVTRTLLSGIGLRGIILSIIGALLLTLEVFILIRGARRRRNEEKAGNGEKGGNENGGSN